jgi:hypothetical protein
LDGAVKLPVNGLPAEVPDAAQIAVEKSAAGD